MLLLLLFCSFDSRWIYSYIPVYFQEGKKIKEDGETLEQRLSSLVWICTNSTNESKVTVIDATNPSNVLESFTVCSSPILCIASVPGATEADYGDENESNNNVVVETTSVDSNNSTDADNGDENSNLGKIKCIECESLTKPEESQNEEGTDIKVRL